MVKMSRKLQGVNIVKVPLEKKAIDRPQIFPKMPILYLEFLENKNKIQQDLINKSYVPKSSPPVREFISLNKKHLKSEQTFDKFESRLDKLLNDDAFSVTSDISIKEDANFTKNDDTKKAIDQIDHHDDSEYTKYDSKKDYKDTNNKDQKDDKDSVISDNTDDLSARLKELLADDSASEASYTGKTVDKYSKHRNHSGHSVKYTKKSPSAVPTLKELEAAGAYVPKKEYRNLNVPSGNEQQESDIKRELLFKFELLKKSYPLATIPEYTIHSDLTVMKNSYDDTVRRLSLDSTVDSYKQYLTYGFIACEYLFGNFLGFDMKGFTQQQLLSMNSYEKLLIELGEKSYVPTGSRWPVELRLLFMIIMNAAFFLVTKMIMKKTGENLFNVFTQGNTNSHKPGRRMKGPEVDLGDLPEINLSGTTAI